MSDSMRVGMLGAAPEAVKKEARESSSRRHSRGGDADPSGVAAST